MSEPRLQDMSDYSTLTGEKRRIVWAVVIAGLIMASVYGAARVYFVPDDIIYTDDQITKVPTVKHMK